MLTTPGNPSSPKLVHPPREPSPVLRELAFLVGHLRGHGWLGAPSRRYGKEVLGRWVAGNQHLLLEMEADYPTDDGRIDRHSAVVLVSDRGRRVESRAYTDGGAVIDYVLEREAGAFAFDEQVPHGVEAVRARKVLSPRSSGYEESLLIDPGDGRLVLYAQVEFQPVS